MYEDNYTDDQIAEIFGYALHLAVCDGVNARDTFDQLLVKYADNIEQFYIDTKDIEFVCGRGEKVASK